MENQCEKRSFIQRQTSGTLSDIELYNDWQRVATNNHEWYNEWQRVTTCGTTNATSFWKHVKQNISRSSYRSSFIKKAALKNFAIFTWKHLKACRNCYKQTYFEEHLRTVAFASVFNKNKRCVRDSKNLLKIGLKNWWIGQLLFKQICWFDSPRFLHQGSNSFHF